MKKKLFRRSALLSFAFLGVALGLFSCAKSAHIVAGGATFPFPLYEKWFKLYQKKGLVVDYQAIGSGAGQEKLADGLLKFAGSDVLMSEDLLKKMKDEGREILSFPATMGAIAILYNVKTTSPLKLSPQTLSEIFLGKITKWDDERILKDNEEIKSELKGEITVVYRSDGSGETASLATYFSHYSREWAQTMGIGKTLNWKLSNAVGSKGSAGVSNVILSKKGSIGYVPFNYASESGLSVASLKNDAGFFVAPSPESVSKSFSASAFRFGESPRLFESKDKEAYALSSVTYVLVDKDLSKVVGREIAEKMIKLFRWMLSDEAQNFSEDYHYAPLPKDLRNRILKELVESINYEGRPFPSLN